MRGPHKLPTDRPDATEGGGAASEVPHDERTFFESFYKASVRGDPQDRMTIGPISDPESRFHYNSVENGIIRALLARTPAPAPAMVEAWRVMQKRSGMRLLDIGSGTGHWVDFFLDVFHVSEVVAVELTQSMAGFLRGKYASRSDVTVQCADIASPQFDAGKDGFDYVTAIGVMFHIVDDSRWVAALGNLARALKPGGLLIVGGDFGWHTRNVQFHKSDEFSNWREFNAATGVPGELRVSRRVRSLAVWSEQASRLGLRVADVVRTDTHPGIATPENDLLILQKPESEEKDRTSVV